MKERPILMNGEMVRAILDGRKTQTRRICKKYPDHFPSCPNKPNYTFFSGAYGCADCGWGHWDDSFKCPYGNPGDRLWVRETFTLESDEDAGELAFKPTDGRPIRHIEETDYHSGHNLIPHYKATDPKPALCCESDSCRQCEVDGEGPHWKPSIHMPRWASRILLEITNIRVERIQDISEEDAAAEGIGRQMAHGKDLGWRNYLWHGDFGNYGMGNKKSDAWEYQYSVYEKAKDCFSSLWELINGPGSWEKNPWVWVIEFKRVNS